MRLARLVVVLVVVSSPPQAAGQAPPVDDTELSDLWLLADGHEAGGRVDEAIAAWERFVAVADAWDRAGRPYGEAMAMRRFQADLFIARILDGAAGEVARAMAAAPPAERAAVTIGHLDGIEPHLRAYLDRFDLPAHRLPERVAVDPDLRLQAAYMLGALLVEKGRAHETLGGIDVARDRWGEARDLLRREIERVLGHPLGHGAATPLDPGEIALVPSLSMAFERYLRAVMLADGAAAYHDEVRAAWTALPRDDHAVLIQMRRQAAAWARDGAHLREASGLCSLVREAHDQWFDGAYAHLMDNVWAHLVDIAIAIREGDLERAEALLAALEAIDGLQDHDRARASRLRSLLDDEVAMSALLDELFALVDRERATVRLPVIPGGATPVATSPAQPGAPAPAPARAPAARHVDALPSPPADDPPAAPPAPRAFGPAWLPIGLGVLAVVAAALGAGFLRRRLAR
jgi:hypothetical protein